MTLMNRLFDDRKTQPYAVRVLKVEGLSRVSFPRLLQLLSPALYDRRTGAGRLIATMPGRLHYQSAITVLALGDSRQDATDYLHQTVPILLKQAVECEAAHTNNDDDPLICSP